MSYTTQTSLVLRNVKGSSLTYNELDGNQYFLSQSIVSINNSAVKTTGNQTIDGQKTFIEDVIITGSLYLTGTAYGTDFVLTSDERLKSNIQDVEDGLEVVNSLRPVKYIKEGREEIGFIAQEVQQILPNLVYQTEEDTLYLSINQIISLNTKAIQELTQKLEQALEEIENLKSKVL
jgi:hypothetical protein